MRRKIANTSSKKTLMLTKRVEKDEEGRRGSAYPASKRSNAAVFISISLGEKKTSLWVAVVSRSLIS